MDRISSEDLRDFLTVTEEGDFSRAAQRQGRHPMLLKESIRELEADDQYGTLLCPLTVHGRAQPASRLHKRRPSRID